MSLNSEIQKRTIQHLVERHGGGNGFRAERGVKQAAAQWRDEDGSPEDFISFCENSFIPNGVDFDKVFDRLDKYFESIYGHFTAMMQDLQHHIHLDTGELYAPDRIFGAYDPAAHLDDDLFGNKLAFFILLNFPRYTLAEKKEHADKWSARDWALARMGDRFGARVPAALQQGLSTAVTDGENYIAGYNIFMNNLRDEKGDELFPKELRLISHWGLRDELKSHYGRENGLRKQELIFRLMERIITQEIPREAIDNDSTKYNPFINQVAADGEFNTAEREPDTRYEHILRIFKAVRKIDEHYPEYPTYIKRKFDLERELSEQEVVALFDKLLSSPQLKKVGELIAKRLGRKLRPFDIWYDGFKARSAISKDELREKVAVQFPRIEAFADNLGPILSQLKFSPEQAEFLASKILVEPARGAGHAWGAGMRKEKAHLRTRVPRGGMDYKGFNIAMHELGHSVEQTFSLHRTGYYTLKGVPSSSFSEAFAFLFQGKDLDVLGITNGDQQAAKLKILDMFWAAAEIMSVALVDLKAWNWLYNHPEADAKALKAAIIEAAQEIWNRYLAEVFGLKDEIILGVYSHMIAYPLYLAEYPLGHVMQFQFESFLEGKNLGVEMERMCATGDIIPQQWMRQAVGSDISVQPMLDSAESVLKDFA